MRYKCCAGAAAEGSRAALSPPVDQWQSPVRGPGDEAPGSSQDPTVYISQKMPKIHPRGPFTLNYNFYEFC